MPGKPRAPAARTQSGKSFYLDRRETLRALGSGPASVVGALCSPATLAIMVGMNHRPRRLRARFGPSRQSDETTVVAGSA
ncbi:hypothetical protein VX037_05910 [Gordonia sp. Z-3]|uniref:Uncharacterized protein n=1 Tax=Gordonia aquimaris TaxID=2984863 RepID=A0A9X3D1Z7_9ACTN|nr:MULTISPECIES: hypothetical protein [Gordonia]MCX2963362.1 hypothetical protein [Gordonia aquimaris]MED5800560.1 hypothetical protein [Gordonia sp. Z-3]